MMYAVRFFKFYISACAVILLASCSAKQGGTSSISIVLPASSSHKAMSQSVSAQSIDFTKACFAINVTGPSIPQSGSSCSPTVGVFSGFKPGGQTVSLEVPMGSARKLEIFLFTRALVGDSCPADFSSVTSDKVALVGSVAGIEMNEPEVTVSVTITAPAVTDSLVTQNIVSASCAVAGPTNDPSLQRLVLGAQRASSGSGHSVEAQLTSIQTMNELSSPSGHKMFLGPKGL